MPIKYKQQFHAVGQGLFYSSLLAQGKSQANIIFDCGSDDIDFINGEVEAYVREVKHIDILILSHLHYDHVSGLDTLLAKVTTVETVVLPYLNKYERMLIQIANGTKTQWYNTFLDKPYDWLNEKDNVQNIVVINGGNDNDSDNTKDNPSDFSQSDNFKVQKHLTNVDDGVKTQIESDEGIDFTGKLSLCNHGGYIQIASLYFKFFNYQIDTKKIK